MNSRKVIVTVFYEEEKLNHPSVEFGVGDFSFEIELSCMIGMVNLSTFFFDGGYLSYEDKKYTLVGSFSGIGFTEKFSVEESTILLAEIKQVTKCAKEGKEYTPATEGLEYYIEYT